MLSAVDIGVADVAGPHQAQQSRLEGEGRVVDRGQHVLGMHAIEPGEQTRAEHLGALDPVEGSADPIAAGLSLAAAAGA